MFHSPIKFSVTVLASAVLAACSGGGSGGGESHSATAPVPSTLPETTTTTTTTTETPNTASETPVAVAPVATATEVQAGFIIPKEGGKIEQLVVLNTNESGDVNNVAIEGHKIEIIPVSQGVSAGSIVHITTKNMARYVGGTNYQFTRWGLVSNEELQNHYLLAGGHATKAENVPVSGTASYAGDAITLHTKDGDGNYVAGNALFNVDFGNKTVNGTIDDTTTLKEGIALSGKIDGNRFDGTSKDGTVLSGGFFGTDAREISGQYEQTLGEKSGYYGVFGAIKQ